MKICQIVPSLELRHGGPSVSVAALSTAMSDSGHAVELLTTHPHTSGPQQQGTLPIHCYKREFPRSICRSSGLNRHLQHCDATIFHHHSLWLRTLHYAGQAVRTDHDRRLVISPRGMMSPWAWGHHRWRKQFADTWIHPGAFDLTAGWHATSEIEADDIRRLGFKQPICVSPNGVTLPQAEDLAAAARHWHEACPETSSRPTALFYSRFHRKKRVMELVDIWLRIAPREWLLLLVGIPEEYSVIQISSHVQRQSGTDRIRVFSGADAPPPYAVAKVFLLPSHSENFGLVIAEAMAAGVPVLVTDTTPWLALNSQDRGWCVPWETYGTTLQRVLSTSQADLAAKGSRAQGWVIKEFSWSRSADRLVEFYRTLPGRSTHRPS